jgi:hypothetical protein
MRSQDSRATVFSWPEIPASIRSPRRSRIVVAPQAQPDRRTWMSFPKMIRSPIRGLRQPSG